MKPGKDPAEADAIAHAMAEYVALFDGLRDGEVARERAPLPGGPQRSARDIKAHCFYLDVQEAGIALVSPDAWFTRDDVIRSHDRALVVAVEFTPEPRPGHLEYGWIASSQVRRAEMRAAEVAVVMAGYIRLLGWSARAHSASAHDVDIARLAVEAGVAEVNAGGGLSHPYLGDRFALGAVTTDYEMTVDRPLAPRTRRDRRHTHGPGQWFGTGGARPGWSALRSGARPLHMGPYPMERIRRVDETTTLITDEVPRVPKRANFFTRALAGDLGPKAQKERNRFAYKTPYSQGYMGPMRAMVPIQYGPVAEAVASGTEDPAANADAVKAAGYFLGADMVGICEVPEFAWYSHHEDGTPIEPYHRYAVVMLIDQGFETMEGASGDDWVSGAQSMRAYMRGAEMAGILAAHLRRLGHGARSQTNIDSDVLHIPLVLLAGLGELSRIGELVLNPFVGPRFKSVVLTTNMPLQPDRPIDFGLLDFCDKCNKCARECPVDAISAGGRVMFNGYEMWKPDVEKCTRYRLTNRKGSACGRCMKMCPFNTEGLMSQRAFLWSAIHLPFTRSWIAKADDWLGNGSRNETKRWWYDMEVVDGVTVVPPSGTNERDIDPGRVLDPSKQKVALYPADVLPPPLSKIPCVLDRKAALERGAAAETPARARERLVLSR